MSDSLDAVWVYRKIVKLQEDLAELEALVRPSALALVKAARPERPEMLRSHVTAILEALAAPCYSQGLVATVRAVRKTTHLSGDAWREAWRACLDRGWAENREVVAGRAELTLTDAGRAEVERQRAAPGFARGAK